MVMRIRIISWHFTLVVVVSNNQKKKKKKPRNEITENSKINIVPCRDIGKDLEGNIQ